MDLPYGWSMDLSCSRNKVQGPDTLRLERTKCLNSGHWLGEATVLVHWEFGKPQQVTVAAPSGRTSERWRWTPCKTMRSAVECNCMHMDTDSICWVALPLLPSPSTRLCRAGWRTYGSIISHLGCQTWRLRPCAVYTPSQTNAAAVATATASHVSVVKAACRLQLTDWRRHFGLGAISQRQHSNCSIRFLLQWMTTLFRVSWMRASHKLKMIPPV